MYKIINVDDISTHFFLSGRNTGASRKLRGNIATISCLIKTSSDDFSEKTKNNYFDALHQSHRWLENQAKRFNVPLKIEGYYFEINASKDTNEDYSWTILKDYFNQDSMEELQKKYEVNLNFDETPFLAVFDKNSRSFAYMQRNVYPHQTVELSTIARDDDKYYYQTIAHELLHQFGAVDLYYPERIRLCAEQSFKGSIMGANIGEIDDLTAYLIGWQDSISADTYQFLKETMWYTKDEYEKALEEAWKGKY